MTTQTHRSIRLSLGDISAVKDVLSNMRLTGLGDSLDNGGNQGRLL